MTKYDQIIYVRDYSNEVVKFDKVVEKLGFSDRSSLVRYLMRLVAKKPSILYEDAKTTNHEEDESIINFLREFKKEVNTKLDQVISNMSKEQKQSEKAFNQMLEELVTDLLKNPELKNCKTVTDLEELFPARFWKDYTPYVIESLSAAGKVALVGGLHDDRLRWKNLD